MPVEYPATPNPQVSVIIVTRNRAEFIGSAVASVLANRHSSFDLTVVDQSSSDATALALQAVCHTDPRLHYVHVTEVGVSRAINTGLRSSSGDTVAFTDDDCIVPPDWLRTIVRAFTSDQDADLLFGTVLPPPQADWTQTVTPAMRFQRPARLTRRDRFREGFRIFGGMGANFAARRRLFHRIGGFDELLGPGAPLPSGQDFDIAYRALCADSVILLRPDVKVIHYGTRRREEWPARMHDYAMGDGALYLKHVRCHDLFALWLLTRWLVRRVGREAIKGTVRRGTGDLSYARYLFLGMQRSLRFGIDPQTRLYVATVPERQREQRQESAGADQHPDYARAVAI